MSVLHKNLCCDPSTRPFQQDSSNEGSQPMVSAKNKKNYPLVIIKYLSKALVTVTIFQFGTFNSILVLEIEYIFSQMDRANGYQCFQQRGSEGNRQISLTSALKHIVTPHLNCLTKTIPMRGCNLCFTEK